MFKFRFQRNETKSVKYDILRQIQKMYNQAIPLIGGIIMGRLVEAGQIEGYYTFWGVVVCMVPLILPIEITIEEDYEKWD